MHARILIAALAALACSAQAATIGFEGFTGSQAISNYDGFVWSGGRGSDSWVVSNSAANIFKGKTAHSGSDYVWNNGGTSLQLEAASGGTFDFDSMWSRSGNGSISFTVEGFLDGREVYSKSIHQGAGYALDIFDFNGIDKLVLSATTPNLLIDDISATLVVASPAPAPAAPPGTSTVMEPGAPALLVAGLGLLAVVGRRRKL
jgi:hypothetical protein